MTTDSTPADDTGEVAVALNTELIAKIWRDHHDCNWVSSGVNVMWSCGIWHPGPIHMQPTTRDRHLAALVMTQIEADRTLARAEADSLRAEVERLREEARLREKSLHACRKVDAERDSLRVTLGRLVALKDGPRDDAYRAAKEQAWADARAILADVSVADVRERRPAPLPNPSWPGSP